MFTSSYKLELEKQKNSLRVTNSKNEKKNLYFKFRITVTRDFFVEIKYHTIQNYLKLI